MNAWAIQLLINRLKYYDEENVTESRLAFRTAILQPSYHGQDDTDCMNILYKLGRYFTSHFCSTVHR